MRIMDLTKSCTNLVNKNNPMIVLNQLNIIKQDLQKHNNQKYNNIIDTYDQLYEYDISTLDYYDNKHMSIINVSNINDITVSNINDINISNINDITNINDVNKSYYLLENYNINSCISDDLGSDLYNKTILYELINPSIKILNSETFNNFKCIKNNNYKTIRIKTNNIPFNKNEWKFTLMNRFFEQKRIDNYRGDNIFMEFISILFKYKTINTTIRDIIKQSTISLSMLHTYNNINSQHYQYIKLTDNIHNFIHNYLFVCADKTNQEIKFMLINAFMNSGYDGIELLINFYDKLKNYLLIGYEQYNSNINMIKTFKSYLTTEKKTMHDHRFIEL